MKNTCFASNGTAAMKAKTRPAFTVVDCRKEHSFFDNFDFAALGFKDEKTFDYAPMTLEEAHIPKSFFMGSIAVTLTIFTACLLFFA